MLCSRVRAAAAACAPSRAPRAAQPSRWLSYTVKETTGSVRRIEDAEPGQTLLDSLKNNGVFVDAPCDGTLGCGLCRVTIDKSHYDKLPQANGKEEVFLSMVGKRHPTSRLACQIVLSDESEGMDVEVSTD
eukprot:m51a1_g10946 hypothetical protein (131) ;mRNA; r:192762-193291